MKKWNPNRQSWRRRRRSRSSCCLLFMLFHFFASPFLSASTLARSRPHLRRRWSVIFLLRQAWVRVPELLPLFSSSCSLSTPPPYFSLFLVIFLFGVLRVLHMRRLASKYFLVWIVLCALLPFFLCFGLYCDGGILECADLGVCFFLFSFFGYSEPFCGWLRFCFVAWYFGRYLLAYAAMFFFLYLLPSSWRGKIWYPKCGELC